MRNGTGGSLAHISLPALLRLQASMQRTVHVMAAHGPWVFNAWFDGGRLVAVQCGSAVGDEALVCAPLLFGSGSYRLLEDEPPCEAIYDDPSNFGAVLEDATAEAAYLKRLVPSADCIPWVVDDLDHASLDALSVTRAVLDVLGRIDGRRTVAELIGTERPFAGWAALAELASAGLVACQPEAPAGARAEDPPPPAASARIELLRELVATAVLIALALVVLGVVTIPRP
jgi:hypothetical protein